MSADVRAQLAAQEVVLKIIARQLLERGLVGGGEVAGDLDGVARLLGPGRAGGSSTWRTGARPSCCGRGPSFFRGPEPRCPLTARHPAAGAAASPRKGLT